MELTDLIAIQELLHEEGGLPVEVFEGNRTEVEAKKERVRTMMAFSHKEGHLK